MSDVDHMWEAIAAHPIAIMTTSQGGRLVSRPMASYASRDEGLIHFITYFGDKTQEIGEEGPVNLGYVDESKGHYLSISGTGRVSRDRAKLKELWGPGAQAWIPEGPEDEKVVLIAVTPEEATLWDTTSSRLVAATKMLAAAVRGTQPDLGHVEHVKMS